MNDNLNEFMNNLWSQFDPGFTSPVWLLVGVLAMIAVTLLEIGAMRRRAQAIALFAAPTLVPGLNSSVSTFRRVLKAILLIAAVGLLFVALARPHLFFQWNDETRSGLDIFLAVDCSKSMETEDVRPNRLERAKLAVEDFAEHVPDDRLGLIAFAGDSFLECPLTLDHQAFLTAVRELDTDTIPRPGTDLASAIDEAVLAQKSQPNNFKFLILVTDGEDLEGRAIASAQQAAKAGLKILAVGVGTPQGGMIPERDESGAATAYHEDAGGQVVQSKLDEDTLGKIAQITGGAYEPLGQHGEGLERIYDHYIAPLPRQPKEERREKVHDEQFEWPLGLAILFLFCEFLIRDRARSGWRASVPVLPTRRMTRSRSLAPPAATLPLLLIGLFLGAETGRAETPPPTTPEGNYDQGRADYRAGHYYDAEEAFRQALNTPDLELQENTYYNLGNSEFKHGEAMKKLDQDRTRELWEQSLQSYDSALKLRSAADTRHNYDLVKKKLEQLKKQQEEQKKQQQNQQKKNGKGQGGQNSQNGQGQDQQQNQGNPQDAGKDPSKQAGDQQQPNDKTGQNGNQPQPSSDKNATAQQRARSTSRGADQQDPALIKTREEAEALLDSLKDDEHRVTARSLNGGNEPPPPPSGKDW